MPAHKYNINCHVLSILFKYESYLYNEMYFSVLVYEICSFAFCSGFQAARNPNAWDWKAHCILDSSKHWHKLHQLFLKKKRNLEKWKLFIELLTSSIISTIAPILCRFTEAAWDLFLHRLILVLLSPLHGGMHLLFVKFIII